MQGTHVAIALVMIAGCGATRSSQTDLLRRARADLHCYDVRVSVLGAGGFRVRGCGRYLSYACRGAVNYRGHQLASGLCVPTDEGGVDDASLAQRELAAVETEEIVARVGSALAACAPAVEILAIEVELDASGQVVGGNAEHLDAAEGACVRGVLEPITLPGSGRAHAIQVVVSNAPPI